MPDETEVMSPEAPDETPVDETVQVDETDQPRDEAGQYATGEDQPPEEGSAEELAPSEAPEAPVTDAEESVPAGEELPEAKDAYQPFDYTADGRSYPIDGALVGEDGVFIPTEQVPHAQQLMAAGRHHMTHWESDRAASQRQVDEALTLVESYKAQAEVIVRQYGELMGLDDEALLAQAEKFRAEWPATQAKSAAAFTEAQGRADKQRLQVLEQADEERRIAPLLVQGLERDLTALGEDPRFEALSQEDLRDVFAQLWQNLSTNQVFVQHDGQWYTNRPVIEQALQYAARLRRGQEKSATKKAAAKKTNEAVTGGKKPPPHVSAKSGPAPSGPVKKVKDYAKLPIQQQTQAVMDDLF